MMNRHQKHRVSKLGEITGGGSSILRKKSTQM
jgi:hypothetical protein